MFYVKCAWFVLYYWLFRFNFVKRLEVTLYGWLGYKPSINKYSFEELSKTIRHSGIPLLAKHRHWILTDALIGGLTNNKSPCYFDQSARIKHSVLQLRQLLAAILLFGPIRAQQVFSSLPRQFLIGGREKHSISSTSSWAILLQRMNQRLTAGPNTK